MYIENVPSHSRSPTLYFRRRIPLVCSGFNVYLRHPELMRAPTRARARSFAASWRPDLPALTYLLKFYGSRETPEEMTKAAKAHYACPSVFANAAAERIKRRLTIVHSYQDITVYHPRPGTRGLCRRGARAICVRRARNGRGIRSSRYGGS